MYSRLYTKKQRKDVMDALGRRETPFNVAMRTGVKFRTVLNWRKVLQPDQVHRRHKYTTDQKKDFLAAIRVGETQAQLQQRTGVHPRTFMDWL